MVKAYEIAHRAMRFTCRFGGMLGIALGVIVTAAHADDAPFVKLAPVTAGASQLERVFFGWRNPALCAGTPWMGL